MKIKLVNDDKKIAKVKIKHDAYLQMDALVKNCQNEIGWLAMVRKEENTYEIYEVIPVKQKVTAVTTELDEKSLQEVTEELLKAGREDELNNIRCWGHSHVNMDCSPSKTDEDTFEEYYKGCKDYFIRLIMNKKGEYNLDLCDYENNIIYLGMSFNLEFDEEEKAILNQIKNLESLYQDKISKKKELYNEKAKEIIKSMVVNDSVARGIKNTIYDTFDRDFNGYNNWFNGTTLTELSENDEIIANAYKEKNTVNGMLIKTNYNITGSSYSFLGHVLNYDDILEISTYANAKSVKKEYKNNAIFSNYTNSDWNDLLKKCYKYTNEIGRLMYL